MPLPTISISKADADDVKYEMIHNSDVLVQQRMLCCGQFSIVAVFLNINSTVLLIA